MTRLFAGTPFDRPPRCDRCGAIESQCDCPSEPAPPQRIPPQQQTAKVRLDRRKHKRLVTVVFGLDPAGNDLAGLVSALKSACGAGGCVKEGCIEIQGDHTDRVRSELLKLGFRVAR